MDYELQEKVDSALKRVGIELYPWYEDEGIDEHSHERYISITTSRFLEAPGYNAPRDMNDSEKKIEPRNIPLVNKVAEALLKENDEELRRVAWNTLCPFFGYEDFIMHEEIEEACKAYNESFEKDQGRNYHLHASKMINTERLAIEPFHLEEYREIHDYVGRYDPKEWPFSRAFMDQKGAYNFSIKEKKTGKLVGGMGIYPSSTREEDVYELQYYIKKGYRGQGYAKEALCALKGIIMKGKIIGLREENYRFILEEFSPKIDILRGFADPDNVPSNKILESLGMEYEGIRVGKAPGREGIIRHSSYYLIIKP